MGNDKCWYSGIIKSLESSQGVTPLRKESDLGPQGNMALQMVLKSSQLKTYMDGRLV